MTQSHFTADFLWTDGAWAESGLAIRDGRFAAPNGGAGERIGRFVLPGMPNLHSHAFQRAMAGLAERRGPGEDSFWTWRETMYAFAEAINPDDMKAIATQLYVEMVKAGYTQVCEFHYLHHGPRGVPYADPAAMSLALIEAAKDAGIGLTLLPVLYMTGGFDGRPLSERQQRFRHDIGQYVSLLERLVPMQHDMLKVGIALHSLRAVPEGAMRAVLATEVAKGLPIHIHIAEQIGEVQDCLAVRGARPVEWLFDHAEVDERWTLVHATHLTGHETKRLAISGAVAGLCPTTEANLGDGLFPLADFVDGGGTFGIGSDSHISVSPVEELRWLEYGQRLVTRHRNVVSRKPEESSGVALWQRALDGGARAAGTDVGRLEQGGRADLLVLHDGAPLLAARDEADVIDTFLFAGNTPLVRDVMVGGQWRVRDFAHVGEIAAAAEYRRVVEKLAAA
ncbi:formimidoylglutamate deiminase [Luteibacter pinisoli]|uniref:Formimidoylglutamate deiminase n=1 Tax=Luteibacter pinisoli TaxID=2589080 RepID=A0A4Y5Z2M1_9GAMM|nr:formimidoylglutamate deiminase [Luteibacter pinisoli]QDE39136.1 formimidoylglutamate deiminase [Luteibacter pinisoli]